MKTVLENQRTKEYENGDISCPKIILSRLYIYTMTEYFGDNVKVEKFRRFLFIGSGASPRPIEYMEIDSLKLNKQLDALEI